MLLSVAKHRAKIILGSLTPKPQTKFRSGPPCTVHISTLLVTVVQCAEFRILLHLLFIDFEKAFNGEYSIELASSILREILSPNWILAGLHPH